MRKSRGKGSWACPEVSGIISVRRIEFWWMRKDGNGERKKLGVDDAGHSICVQSSRLPRCCPLLETLPWAVQGAYDVRGLSRGPTMFQDCP